MRIVKFRTNEQDHLGGEQSLGYFHCWDTVDGNALVELADGSVKFVPVSIIQFIHRPPAANCSYEVLADDVRKYP